MKMFCVVLTLSLFLGCAAGHLSKYCDSAQGVYLKANASARALHDAGTIPENTWNTCVVPLDHAANDAIVACYKAAISGNPAELIKSLADAGKVLSADYAALNGCK